MPSAPRIPLAPADIRLLNLLAEGHSLGSAAALCDTSTQCMKNRIKAIRLKMDCKTTIQAVLMATRLGYISALDQFFGS